MLASSTTEKAAGSACESVTRNADSAEPGGTGRHGRASLRLRNATFCQR